MGFLLSLTDDVWKKLIGTTFGCYHNNIFIRNICLVNSNKWDWGSPISYLRHLEIWIWSRLFEFQITPCQTFYVRLKVSENPGTKNACNLILIVMSEYHFQFGLSCFHEANKSRSNFIVLFGPNLSHFCIHFIRTVRNFVKFKCFPLKCQPFSEYPSSIS